MNHTQRKLIPIAAGLSGLIAAGFIFGGGCGDQGLNLFNSGEEHIQTAMALSTEIDSESEISGMRYDIVPVDCQSGAAGEGTPYTYSGTLEQMTFPADLVPDSRLHEDSAHKFADHYKVLDAGCYDVMATPLVDGQPFADCIPAHARAVRVRDGATTEVTLISQCKGKARGGLDVAATLNRAPHIDALVYTPSKFVAVCQMAEICVTAVDPDKDPLEILFSRQAGPDQGGQVVHTTSVPEGEGVATRCIEVEPSMLGTYEYRVEVYDMLYDEQQRPLRYEELYAQMGKDVQSRDSLEFPLHVSASDEFECKSGTSSLDMGSPQTSTDGGRADSGRITEEIGGGGMDMGASDMGAPETNTDGGRADSGNVTEETGDGGTDMGTNPDSGGNDDQEQACTNLSNAQLRQQINCTINGGDVTFTIPQGACAEQLSFSTYELPDGTIHPFEEQVLYRNQTASYGPGTYNLSLELPAACGYQADLYVGGELAKLDPNCGHCNRILCYDFQEQPDCPTCQGSCEVQSTQDATKPSHATIEVSFECDSVVITSSKDLSNVVLEYEDGTTQKFDNLNTGTSGTFSGTDSNAGKRVVTAWVKAGSYKSGDGPGYGERFDSCQ